MGGKEEVPNFIILSQGCMSVYLVKNPESALSSVEFSPVAEGNFSFFHVKDPAQKQAIKDWLTSKEMGQELVADTKLDGHDLLVTHGEKSREDMLKALAEHGDKTELKVYKKPFNYWAARGAMSIVGQCLQLASATLQVEQVDKNHPLLKPENPHFNPKYKEGMYVRKPFSADIGAFAILNLTANFINILYGGQKEEATNQLRAIKSDLNANLNDHVAKGEHLCDVNDSRTALRQDDQKPKTAAQHTNDFIQKHSVRIGEIGLRYLGALALVLPTNRMGNALAAFKSGGLRSAYNAAKNPNSLTLMSGYGYLLGKTLALFAKVPDPYDPKPHTMLDTIREDYLFKVGGLIEAVAGGSIGYGAFAKKKIGFADPKSPGIKPSTDYLGGIGGSLFAAGYIVRLGASFGSKNLDTDELFAHATDTLAKTSPEKLPQLMAEASATLKEHLKDKPVEYNELFTKMMTDMYRYHHIALDNLGTEPEERVAAMTKRLQPRDPRPDQPLTARQTIVRQQRSPAELAAAGPAGNFADRALKAAETAQTSQVGV
jgi:hypothetical protein